MTFPKAIVVGALAPLAFALTCAGALAQGAAPSSTPAPASTPTLMDRAYDGDWHVNLIPYVWLPTLRTNLQYTIPQLPTGYGGGASFAKNVQVGPSDYLTNLNTAGQIAFNIRKGEAVFLGDFIYLNLSANATAVSSFTGPLGKVKIPATFTTNMRTATSLWELAAGWSLGHSHNADANLVIGWRQLPITNTMAYTAVIGGPKASLTRNGTVRIAPVANDVIFGVQGRVFLGDGHWYVPYYADIGSGYNQQTWEAYGGAGYAFPHGQSLIATFRTLQYNAFPTDSPVKKLSLWGPLFGYSFGI